MWEPQEGWGVRKGLQGKAGRAMWRRAGERRGRPPQTGSKGRGAEVPGSLARGIGGLTGRGLARQAGAGLQNCQHPTPTHGDQLPPSRLSFLRFYLFIYLFIFREQGREGEREGKIHRSVASHTHCNWGSNLQPRCPDPRNRTRSLSLCR